MKTTTESISVVRYKEAIGIMYLAFICLSHDKDLSCDYFRIEAVSRTEGRQSREIVGHGIL